MVPHLPAPPRSGPAAVWVDDVSATSKSLLAAESRLKAKKASEDFD